MLFLVLLWILDFIYLKNILGITKKYMPKIPKVAINVGKNKNQKYFLFFFFVY